MFVFGQGRNFTLSASLVEESTFQLPVYVVMGQNWACEVKLNEEDLVLNITDAVIDFDEDTGEIKDVWEYNTLLVEAATKAIEVFEGLKPPDNFELFDDDEEPYVGGVLYVFLKDSDPDKGSYIASFIAFGNAGFYKEAQESYELFQKESAAAQKEYEKEKKAKAKKKLEKKNKKDKGK